MKACQLSSQGKFVFLLFLFKKKSNFILFFYYRQTKTGDLPNLSYIARKPEPLGTEFKVVVDGISGCMSSIEIQEGKERMKKKEFNKDLGTTAGCVMRMIDELKHQAKVNLPGDWNEWVDPSAQEPEAAPSQDGSDLVSEISDQIALDAPTEIWLGDSWFGSVKSVAHAARRGVHAVTMVKTAHSRSPKKFLEAEMQGMPGGVWIVLEGRAKKEGVDLLALGYKYNSKNVLTFVYTRGAATSAPGVPYEARFPDSFGNVCVRHVARPAVVSTYFKYSNLVDLHNQSRQFDLALEKKWVTHDAYFRLYTTMLGFCVTDAWKLMRKKLGNCAILDFADILAWEMIKEAEDIEEKGKKKTRSGVEFQCQPVASNVASVPIVCKGSSEISTMTPGYSAEHTREFMKNKQSRCIWCSRVLLTERKTTMKCIECGFGFCRDRTGRNCWSLHVALGGVPQQPKRGKKKRKVND